MNSTELAPHRGGVVLALGILGLVMTCVPLSIIAWVMANGDLGEIDAGRMDPTGRELTNAGKILGVVGTLLVAVVYLATIVLLLIFVIPLAFSSEMH